MKDGNELGKKQLGKCSTNHEKLGMNQKMGVMLCALCSAVATGYVPNYINLYYTDNAGISMAAVGLVLMIMKVTDGVTDIIMGMIVDRTHTRLGKARPWVLAGGAGLALSMVLLFHCPEQLSTSAKILFCAAFYFLVNPFFGTMVSVACGTLNNLVTADSNNRSILGVFSAYGSLIPVLLIGLVVPKVLSALNESQKAYDVVTVIFAGMALIAAIVGTMILRETVTERSEKNLTEKQTVGESIKALFKNKYFIYLAIGTILYNLAAVPVANYYAKYIFHDVGVATLINLPSVGIVFLLPFAVPLIRRFGKRNCVVLGLLSGTVGCVIMFIANANLPGVIIGKCIASLGTIPFTIALIPMTGEICDYALYRTGKPMDGTISSAATMGGKIGIGLTAGISSLLLGLSVYISSTADMTVTQPASAIFMIRFLMGVYPAVVNALSAFCFWKIDLEKQGIENIQRELREKGMR